LRAGYDWLAPRKLKSIESELDDRNAQLRKIQAGLQSILEVPAEALDSDKRMRREKLKLAEESLHLGIRALESRRDQWLRASQTRGSIAIYGTIRPGSEIMVDGKTRVLTDDRQRERFVLEGGSVIGVPLK
ncbi:MAG: hypothetical protein ACYDAG_05795, partial [Chloroflexota bacterium]